MPELTFTKYSYFYLVEKLYFFSIWEILHLRNVIRLKIAKFGICKIQNFSRSQKYIAVKIIFK